MVSEPLREKGAWIPREIVGRMPRELMHPRDTALIKAAIIEKDMTLSLVNDEFARLTGYSKEEMEGKVISMDVVAESDRQRLEGYHRLRRMDSSLAPREYEFRILTKSGETKDCRAIISVFPGTGQSIVSLVDLSEQKRMQRELQTRSMETSRLLDSIDV